MFDNTAGEGIYELFLKNWRCHYVTMSPGYLTSLKKCDNMTFWQQHNRINEEGIYELFLKNWRCHYVTMCHQVI